MFTKRGIQKNVKKRVAVSSEKDEVSSDETPHSDDEAGSLMTAVLSGSETKKRRTAAKQCLTMTTIKEEKNGQQSVVKHVYESTHMISEDRGQRVTATVECDTATDRDHRAILERNEKIGKAILSGELEEGIYRGLGAHRPILNRREGAISAGKHSGLYGPVRGNQHVRMTMRIDLNPEICKDYKETGYCGFGDTCIFLHDRSDYKPGWQLEKEWEEEQKKKQEKYARRFRRSKGADTSDGNASGSEENSSSDEEDGASIPSSCSQCGTIWAKHRRPVVTQCHHYFCEQCALAAYAKSSKCAQCGEPTNGVFNAATVILNRLERDQEDNTATS